MKKLIGLISIAVILIAVSSNAQVILSWEFSGNSGITPDPETADFFGTNISSTSPSGALTRGSGIVGASNTDGFSSNNWSTSGVSSLSEAITAGDYYSFSIGPEAGFSINLSALDINFQTTGSGPDSWGLFSSLDSFSSAVDTFTLDGASATINLDVSDSSFDTLTSTVEFRLAGFGATGSTGAARFNGSGSDIVFSGLTSAIPEPSTYTLIFGGLALGLVAWRKRRKLAEAV
ncbi:MAG: PEP-CTERM sorting domain-containing protein [Verrucomicrobia bacterium]|nr:PEP-CTERM sorting domain-containing protein [Verrucomicrobiota bacterium]